MSSVRSRRGGLLSSRKQAIHHAVAPSAGAEIQTALHSFSSEPDPLKRALLDKIVGLRSCLEPVSCRRVEEVVHEQPLRLRAIP